MKLGIIGYGGMAGWHHENAPRVPGVEVVAATDIDHVRVQIARDKGLIGYDRLEDFLADPTIDTVLIATPNDQHCELSIAASNAGKHVICEKPVALSMDELDRMIDAAQKNGKLFTVHQNRRWDKDYQTMLQVLRSGKLGKVYSIQSRLHGCGGQFHGWRSEASKGGGMLLDWGVHFLDQLLGIQDFALPKWVMCTFESVINPDVDDYFLLQMELADGTRTVIEIGTWVLYELPRWMVMGDRATMHIESFSAKGAITSVDELAEDKPVLLMTAAGPTRTFAPRPDSTKLTMPLPEVNTDWTEYYQNICDAVDGKAELIVQPWQVRNVQKVIIAAFESVRTGQVVYLNQADA